ncbi:hypothetical protein LCGC14_1119740 [marine sediment metagenome]|uniref:Uncharacterized protein n=1 Tax=marine sediment metagenome TaxID=412755 RepID=A0A0F9QA21_9ZZZZ
MALKIAKMLAHECVRKRGPEEALFSVFDAAQIIRKEYAGLVEAVKNATEYPGYSNGIVNPSALEDLRRARAKVEGKI